jgi:hypothetical protein
LEKFSSPLRGTILINKKADYFINPLKIDDWIESENKSIETNVMGKEKKHMNKCDGKREKTYEFTKKYYYHLRS